MAATWTPGAPAAAVAGDPPGYPRECECRVLLADGSEASVRPIRPGDAAALSEFHEGLSAETVYLRYFTPHPHLGPDELEHLTCVDYRDRLALVVESGGVLSAVGRFDREPGGDVAEVAFVVADRLQGRGVGTLLLEHLASAARRRGISRFSASVLGGNFPMSDVFRRAGFDCTQGWDGGVVEVSVGIEPTQGYLDALLRRQMKAARAWLAPRVVPGPPGIGVAWSAATAASAATCGEAGSPAAVSTVLVTGGSGIDSLSALAYLGADPHVEAVALDVGSPPFPARLVALGRAVTARKPVAVWAGPGCEDVCDQAGFERVEHPGDLVGHAGSLLGLVRSGGWVPPARGSVVRPERCDVAGVFRLLEGARCAGAAGGEPLTPALTAEILRAYGVATDPGAGRPAEAGSVLTVGGWHPLLAGVGSPRVGLSRFLPLTDTDAAELASVLAAGRADLPGIVLRLARLVDDQPLIRDVTVDLGAPAGSREGAWALRTGPARDLSDDPLVRRLT